MSEHRWRLNHLNLTVRDLDTSADFYRRWFGFTLGRRFPDGTLFLTDGAGFDLALHEGTPPSAAQASSFHFGFAVPTPDHVRALRADLEAADVPLVEHWEGADHASVKCLDPDSHVIEVYWDAPRSEPQGSTSTDRLGEP